MDIDIRVNTVHGPVFDDVEVSPAALLTLFQFQGFTQELMMLTGNLMKFKLRLPGFMKKALYTMTEKTVNDIFNKNDYTDAGVMKSVVAVRQYAQRLGFSQQWITNFVYKVVMLAKKEPKPKEQ